jgi:surface antigen
MGVDQLHELQVLLEAGASDESGVFGSHDSSRVARFARAGQGLEVLKYHLRRRVSFTGRQPASISIDCGMSGFANIGPARALCLGLAGAALAACASTPAPIMAGGRPSAVERLPDFDGDDARVVDYGANLQCVPFARQASGVQIFGDANTWWRQAAGRYPRSNSPAYGSVFVLNGYNNPGRGHVAVVTHIDSSRLIRVDHANWLNGGEISRGVPVLDVSPNNDWSEVRVWHIPGGHWGGRVYQAEGFIHPFQLQAAMG